VLLDYGTGLPEEYVGDFQRLRQILINLVGNAVKFTPQGSVVVRVRGQARAGRVALEIAVEDTGIGIAREYLSHIFTEFARVEGSSTRRFEGTGLGLAICKRLAQMMAGEITVESELGVGTIFTLRLRLPVAEDELPVARHLPATAPARPAEPRPAARLLVLMAEDNRTNQIVVSMMLENEPIDLRIANNGREAIALFHELAPDVVLMDVCMPEMDGFAATSAIRRAEAEHGLPRTPVVALTAHSGKEHRTRCLENDMDDYLSKPLNRSDLIKVVFAHGRPSPARRTIAALAPVGAAPCA
jgi:CheY-like chemotaxis protein